jgi:putative aldouronate transport system permease protein
MTILAAYVLSRRNLRIRKTLTLMIVVTMYLSAGMIPDFLLIKYLGLYNNRLAILLPNVIVTWNLIVMRTAFNQIPRSLEESAMIDGASDFSILVRIILPVSKAAIAVMILFYAVGHWNSWFSAVIYLRDRSKFPLQLFLREILTANASMGAADAVSAVDTQFLLDELIKYCSVVVSTVPILVIYPFAQKYFITGVMLGSLKE